MKIIITCILTLLVIASAKNNIPMKLIPQTKILAQKYGLNFFSSQLETTSQGNGVQMFTVTGMTLPIQPTSPSSPTHP